MKKILIWDMFPLTNTGGPAGYLYNIKEYLKEHPTDQITFLSDLVQKKLGQTEWKLNKRKEHKFQITNQLDKAYTMCLKPFWTVEYPYLKRLNIDEYDFVHIHIITHVSQFRKLFPKYKGKVILTIHCPCTWTDEIISYTASPNSQLRKIVDCIRPLIMREECRAYDLSDYIMFPCEGAREPYEKDAQVRVAFQHNNHKFFYVPSSIVDYKVDFESSQKLSEFGIPNDAFVITYFGRHISVKGYDILRTIADKLLDKYPNLYFVCAGKGDINPPSHPRWKELGFISNVDDLLPQGDLYILPNRETYFDLITLQVLRAGVPLILSTTGGNKYFRQLPSSETIGLKFFDIDDIGTLEGLVSEVIGIKQANPSIYVQMKSANRALYEHHFTMQRYIINYLQAINQL